MRLLTDTGYKNILDCSIGEQVKYFDINTGEVKFNSLLAIEQLTAKNYPDQLVTIPAVLDKFGQEVTPKSIEVTPIDTKWYTINGQYTFFAMQSVWVNLHVKHASQIEVGDTIYDDNDGDIVVTSVESFTDKDKIWYRLTISGDHSFVADGVTEHNASRYWVGGTGTWDASSTTHWGSASGTADNASVPGTGDDVIFDSASNATAYTMTTSGTLNCANQTMGAPLAGALTWSAGGATLNCYGSVSFAANQVINNSGLSFSMNATSGTKTITTNDIQANLNWKFNGSGGTFQLAGDLGIGAGSFDRTAGTFDPSTYIVAFVGASHTITGDITFYQLRLVPNTAAKTNSITLAGNPTVTNLLTISNGATATNRVLIFSSFVGTARTITAASISIANADFRDITGAGAASWDMSAASGGSGNCGGNTMQALGDAAFTTAADQHWVQANGGSWSTAANWTSRVPLPQDNVFMDCAFGTSKTVTADMPRIGKNVSWTGATWTTALTWSNGVSITMHGNLTLITGLTTSGTNTLTFEGRGSQTITTNGVVLTPTVATNAAVGTYSLADNLVTNRVISVASGTLSAVNGGNNYTITTPQWALSGGTLALGSGTHIWNGTGGFNITGTTIAASTGTIKQTDTSNTAITFTGNGQTFNNLWFDRGTSTGNITIAGSNTFAEFKDTGTAAHSILFAAATAQNISTFTVNGSAGKEITINSTTTGIHTINKTGGGKLTCDYLNIQHSVVRPLNVWYATNSTNNQATATAGSGWIFSAQPAASTIAAKRNRGRFNFTPISNG